jgi:hypothetical protein
MLNLDSLVVEVTRRCNMKCGHCMRGEPQNKTMRDEYMYDFLRQVSYISNVTFSGGEPTLPSGIKVIERFMEICNDLGVEVGNFYMVTNAKVWRPELPELINRLFDFCSENEISSVDISGDRFHETDSIEVQDFRYRLSEELEFKYGLSELVSVRPDIEYQYVIAEGRGCDVNDRELNIDELLIRNYDDEDSAYISEGTLYLNCDGKVINGCDWSYESQASRDDIVIGLASDNLDQTIENYEFTFFEEE